MSSNQRQQRVSSIYKFDYNSDLFICVLFFAIIVLHMNDRIFIVKNPKTRIYFNLRSEVSHIYRGVMTCLPPSTWIKSPVINEAASEAKKAIVLATSSTVPGLPSACVFLQCSRNYMTKSHMNIAHEKIRSVYCTTLDVHNATVSSILNELERFWSDRQFKIDH